MRYLSRENVPVHLLSKTVEAIIPRSLEPPHCANCTSGM